jgi:DNA polymerase-3 subunit epsilon
MTPSRAIASAFLAAGAALVIAWLALEAFVPVAQATDGPLRASLIVLAAIVVFVVLWLLITRWLTVPLARLASEVHLLADARGGNAIDPQKYHMLSPLPTAVNELAEQFARAQSGIDHAVAAATARAEEQKGRLEALLRDLSEGVIVCNPDHEILLYNYMAVRILGSAAEFGLGRSLFRFITREPVMHVLEWLTAQPDRGRADAMSSASAFVCATADARTLLQGRMSLIVDDKDAVSGYVLTLADATREITALGKRDALLRAAIEGVRGPIANLRAAAETLAAHPGMPEEQRRAFESIIVNESAQLSDRLASLAQEHRSLIDDSAVMGDLHSLDLFNCVIRRARDSAGLSVTMTGLPQWLHGDSYALMVTLASLISRIHKQIGVTAFDIEARPGERGCYVDIVWQGEPLPSVLLSSWLEAPLEGNLGGLTLRNVLDRHHSDLWSQADRPGYARLRVPLLKAARKEIEWRAEPLPERPEFYDFDLLRRPKTTPELGSRPLRSFTYVVFDTETTGLKPIDDEIVAVAGVRNINGRILTGETFSRLVNPGRPIPQASTVIHRITDAMVRDRPPITVVLPQFKAFVGDAVLVAHNIAFDLSFLKAQEKTCGVRFDNPVLDTMLLSSTLYEHAEDHTLDGLARRFGVEAQGRHTALGDAMITAAVLVAMFDALERRGIRTLEDAVRASRVVIELKTRQAQFAAGGRP